MTVSVATSRAEREAAFAVREAVFVDEQGIDRALDFDGRDEAATHLIAVADGPSADDRLATVDDGVVVGTARLREPEPGRARGERLAVAAPYRGDGHGSGLTERLVSVAAEWGCEQLVVHAQASNVEFCRAHGFETVGEPFEEAGIRHREMHHDLGSGGPTEESSTHE
ncbi:MAG: GCN5-related N-acetyltransferase [halophilic archaeon J07HB67]|nr:MAG: GCN5-related N-acetyltransferase [halophilic archaeon J07HB67]